VCCREKEEQTLQLFRHGRPPTTARNETVLTRLGALFRAIFKLNAGRTCPFRLSRTLFFPTQRFFEISKAVADVGDVEHCLHHRLLQYSMSISLPTLLYPLAAYLLPASASNSLSLILVQGSVLDFGPRFGPPAAIVNAANVGCRGGGGVDGAISNAGGRSLDRDRSRLPVVAVTDSGEPVRCPEGQAVVTGPGNYGSLHVPYVIHAVGPNYYDYDDLDDLTPVHNLLKSAYKAALDRAVEHKIQSVAFSLLSAGVFRGSQPLETVLAIGVTAIQEWSVSYANRTGVEGGALLSQIVLCAYTPNECKTLKAVCDHTLES
jgi:O-acetyl-ADP-ribose deacetylase (regulator of RNase III)